MTITEAVHRRLRFAMNGGIRAPDGCISLMDGIDLASDRPDAKAGFNG
jgi:hypothetical protein